MTPPKRSEQQVDPYLRTVGRYRKRNWDLKCDCPCHFYPGIREAVACCQMRGMKFIASENAYIPWPDQ